MNTAKTSLRRKPMLRRQLSSPWSVAISISIVATTIVVLPSTGMPKMGLATALAPIPSPHHNTILDKSNNDRRRILEHGLLGLMAAAFGVPKVASAGIDVSGLKVEANPLDVFLGGTYYENDDESRTDGRISRRKYTIVEASTFDKNNNRLLPSSIRNDAAAAAGSSSKKDFFEGLAQRPVKILGESTSISSSRDDSLTLNGNLSLCNTNETTNIKTNSSSSSSKGCIEIDFSPIGGPPNARGYWDDKEGGIRFLDGQKVWSKQGTD